MLFISPFSYFLTLSFLCVCAFLLFNMDKMQPKALLKLNVNLLLFSVIAHFDTQVEKHQAVQEVI